MTWVDNPFLRQLMDEINAVPPPGRAASSPMFKQPAGASGKGRMAQETYDPIQGMDRAADASQEQGDESELAAQEQAEKMTPEQQAQLAHQGGHVSLDPSRQADQSALLHQSSPEAQDAYMRGELVPAAGAQKVDFESPIAADAPMGPGLAAEQSALDHPVAKAIVGSGKRHTALRQFLDMVHKPEQK